MDASELFSLDGNKGHCPVEVSVAEILAGQPVASPCSGRVGVLLVHGLNGGKSDMEELGALLQAQGWCVELILLPGHGTDVRDMLPIGWAEWAQAVREALHELRERCDHVFLVGHSLGGALCLHMAASEPVAGLVTMCAPISMYPGMLAAVRVVKRFTPWLPTLREDVRDKEARRRYARGVYRHTPMAPVESMLQYLPLLRAELPNVTAPILIMTAIHDHVVPARDGRTIYRLIGSQEKQLVTFHRSYHVIMKDHDREEVFERTLAFIQRHLPSTSS
ncbi:alpha/beta hydrolase [Dictyobacter aurantiacus]|uniref:Esterase n=1 Tax=Dictyobacter aurantiacus TaxID=1936993 RepID=A0A401ZF77_9CHLR|nr:alpha/beta fold hydrolase [Dictyobacter aurantiacus]GCE05517.1 esterase [Dictyobacter aurantiacus]